MTYLKTPSFEDIAITALRSLDSGAASKPQWSTGGAGGSGANGQGLGAGGSTWTSYGASGLGGDSAIDVLSETRIGGRLHSTDDEPAKLLKDGSEHWYCRGELHRGDDKPAIMRADGSQVYYTYGSKHREFGPAVINGSGDNLRYEWWIHHDECTFGEYCTVMGLTDEERAFLKLQYC